MQQQPHWRPGERPIESIEQAVAWAKAWVYLQEQPPSRFYVSALEVELVFILPDQRLASAGTLWLRGHEEQDGQIFVSLWLGSAVIRRAHLNANHREPDAGPITHGTHIHFPTSVFREIGRRGRSRAYPWDVPDATSLRDAVRLFAQHLNVISSPDEQRRLLENSNGLQ